MKTSRREAFTALAAMVGGSSIVAARQAAPPVTSPSSVAVPGLATVSDFEPVARQTMSQMAYDYVAGGAGDVITLRDNIQAFDRLRLHPRVLADVSQIDTKKRCSTPRRPSRQGLQVWSSPIMARATWTRCRRRSTRFPGWSMR